MSLDAVRRALDMRVEPSSCSGSYRLTEPLALMLPDGDVAAAEDPRFGEWLLAHAEPAPFGLNGATLYDWRVRRADRLAARGAVQVVGFAPAAILDEIEGYLSPRWHLEATLADVIAYPTGGRFARHKDTPRSASLIGTLIVEVPSAHDGGTFVLDDGRQQQRHAWSHDGDSRCVRWVAMYGDVDHAVEPVTSGLRIALVYALHVTDRVRDDAGWPSRRAELAAACAGLRQVTAWPAMIACARHVVVEDRPETQPVTVLRGLDRDLADALLDAGYRVTVRACLAAQVREGRGFPRFPSRDDLFAICRLRASISPALFVPPPLYVSLSDNFDSDGGDRNAHLSLERYLLEHVPLDRWVIRTAASATVLHEAETFSEDGYFGNEGYEALLYSLAALEVTRS